MDIFDVRLGNVKAILNCLGQHDGMTKKEIAERTGLSFSTVSNTCNALREKKILDDQKVESATVGRTPRKLRIQFNSFLTLCLNIQRKNSMIFSILNYRSDLLFHRTYDISRINGVREIATFARETLLGLRSGEEAQDTSWLEGAKFLGVGVVVSGIFDKNTQTVVGSAILSMEGAPVKAVMEEIFGMPCYVDNESNLCAIAQQQRDPDCADLLYMHISQGVGIGIVSGGSLLRGHNGYAAEIAHIPLGSPRRKCLTCGNYGCIESDLSVSGMLDNGVWKDNSIPDQEQWALMVRDIHQNTAAYREFIRSRGTLIGSVLAILIDLFDPQRILVGGEIADIFELVRPYAESVIRKRCYMAKKNLLPIRCDKDSGLGMILGLNQVMCKKWNPLEGDYFSIQ